MLVLAYLETGNPDLCDCIWVLSNELRSRDRSQRSNAILEELTLHILAEPVSFFKSIMGYFSVSCPGHFLGIFDF